ncbi:MAG TPA: hypothetical protein VFP70_07470, partial [Burkholderiales bacterium]|nr:hypothetical protein [Burkholderiales bacterium]
MSCKHDCETKPLFPRPVENRPGLPTLAYRVGGYAEMRAHMLARISAHPLLAAWTHRGADDPGIALVEGAAIVGDILSFYQELYANEFYLRTAKWRESVADLVRLLGYRLAPGLGGDTRFALLAKGERPVTVPKGFGFTAQIEGQPQPVVFEASAALTAWPQLSSFHLYRPRLTPAIHRGEKEFQVLTALPSGLTLSPGDRLLLGVATPSAANPAELKHAQIAVVDRVWESFGATHVAIRGGITNLAISLLRAEVPPLQGVGVLNIGAVQKQMMQGGGALPQMFAGSPGTGAPRQMQQAVMIPPAPQPELAPASASELFAFKLGASHRHYGHNAPPQETKVDAKGRATVANVSFARRLDITMGPPAVPSIAASELPLDAAVDNLSPGIRVVVEGRYGNSAGGAGIRRWLVRGVSAVEKRGAGWSTLTGPSTVLTLDSHLAAKHGALTLNYADLRSINVHVVSGAGFRLQAVPRNTDAKRGRELDFYGT